MQTGMLAGRHRNRVGGVHDVGRLVHEPAALGHDGAALPDHRVRVAVRSHFAHGVDALEEAKEIALEARRTAANEEKEILVVAKEKAFALEQEADQRVRKVALTEAGARLLEKARPFWAQAQSQIHRKLGQHKWSNFLNDLSAMIAAVRDP